MTLFRNKFRNETARHTKWNYSAAGSYFVTIAVHPRNPVFGTINAALMINSPAGQIANMLWQEIVQHYPEVVIGPFVVMPDHIHGIITIRQPECLPGESGNKHQSGKCHTLGNIVGSYKSAVTKKIHEAGIKDFRWQERFYDRIIRNEDEYRQIERYIMDNPRKWWETHGSRPDNP